VSQKIIRALCGGDGGASIGIPCLELWTFRKMLKKFCGDFLRDKTFRRKKGGLSFEAGNS
jgi:hypothetical protein